MNYNLSIIITTYNEENNIKKCLKNITNQNILSNINYEIIIVDDYSDDRTVEICKEFTDKIFFSGKKFCEISRYIGFKKAKYENILFLDADNFMSENNLLENLVIAHIENPNTAGLYPYKFNLNPNDSSINQYCSIFGINDPYQWFLKSTEHFSYFTKQTQLEYNKIEDKEKYFKINFKSNHQYTLGAICFLTKKNFIEKYNQKDGYLFHSDVFNSLINIEKEAFFIVTKKAINHQHCKNIFEYFKKIFRNGINYKKYKNFRTKKHWAVGSLNFYLQTIKMLLFVPALLDSLLKFFILKKKAVLLHPLISFIVPLIYIYIFLFHGKKKSYTDN